MNQDAYGRVDDPERGEILLIVADGLGGHRGGEVASRMAIRHIGENFVAEAGEGRERLERAILGASEAILKESRRDRTLDGMGTTVVCLLLTEAGPASVAHVGDSRLYRLRDGSIAPLTEDHSLVATLVREGALSPEAARDDPRRNQILRALGVREGIEVDTHALEVRPGDRYLLCSDGLHGMLDDPGIAAIVEACARASTAVERLIEAANEAGGTDNVTCLLAAVPRAAPPEGLRHRLGRIWEAICAVFSSRPLPSTQSRRRGGAAS